MRLTKHSFSGTTGSYADKGNKKFNNQMSDAHIQKLKKTKILNQDFKKAMEKVDSKNTLHYLDPPYVGAGKAYSTHGVSPKDVCDAAKKMKGKVLISYDNHPEVRKNCKGFRFRKINFPYSARAGHTQGKTELLITNY